MVDRRAGRSAAKQEQVLAAATRLFLANGYAATSMDAIRIEAGVSKPTLYSRFESKEDLFSAALEGLIDRQLEGWPPTQSGTAIETQDDLRGALLDFARRFLTTTLGEPSHLALLRVVISEAPRVPALRRAVQEATILRALRLIGSLLQLTNDSGLTAVSDVRAAGRLFLGSLVLWLFHDGLLGEPQPSPPQPSQVEALVDLFLVAVSSPHRGTQVCQSPSCFSS